MLSDYSNLIFCTVALRLVNDDDAICKKACARILQELIDRLPHNQRTKLYDMVIKWLKSNKVDFPLFYFILFFVRDLILTTPIIIPCSWCKDA